MVSINRRVFTCLFVKNRVKKKKTIVYNFIKNNLINVFILNNFKNIKISQQKKIVFSYWIYPHTETATTYINCGVGVIPKINIIKI